MKLDNRDLHGRTVMHYACWFKYPDIFKYLLSQGIKPDEMDTFGRGCFDYALSQPINGIVDLIKEEHLVTMLETVVTSLGDTSSVIVDRMGRSALHFVCFESNQIALEYFLKAGFILDVVDNDGKTPLDYASKEFIDITNELLTTSQDTISRHKSKKKTINRNLHSGVLVLYTHQSKYKRNDKGQEHFTTDSKSLDDRQIYCNINTEGTSYIPMRKESLLDGHPQFNVLTDADLSCIKKDIQRLIYKLANELKKTEPRFLSNLAGSVSEGTKLKPPDEFDFQFHLMEISHCFVIDELKFGNNNVSLAIKPSHNCDPLVKKLMQPSVSVNKALFDAFHSAVYTVIRNYSFWKDLPFYWHHHNLAVSAMRGRIFPIGTLTAPFRLKWVGIQQSDIDISVDLVPILVVDCLPDNVLAAIPDKIIKFVDKLNFKLHIVCRESDDARLSFFSIEKYILCCLMPELRRSYTLAKAISKYCGEKFSLDSDYVSSYMLKNALFYELDPNSSFSLVASTIMVNNPVNKCHAEVLSSMKETLENKIAETGCSFIQGWTWKIFDRLERWFSSEDGVHVYCRPSVTFPDIMIVDLEHESPQRKSLQIFKGILEKPKAND